MIPISNILSHQDAHIKMGCYKISPAILLPDAHAGLWLRAVGWQ